MKIALLLSGNMRTFDMDRHNKISDYYKQLCNKYDLDVFCYTDDNNFYYKNIQHMKKTEEENGNYVDESTAYSIIKNLLQQCFGTHLKGFNIIPYYKFFVPFDPENKYHKRFYQDDCRPLSLKHNLLNNAFKVWKAYQLLDNYEKQEHIQYDVIIKSRFDCIPYDILNTVDIRTIDYKNTLICGYWSGFLFDHGAIGNREIMHHYCNYYNVISPNLIDNIRMYWKTDVNPWLYSHTRVYNNMTDISDSIEYGLTYLITILQNYKLNHYNINFRYHIVN